MSGNEVQYSPENDKRTYKDYKNDSNSSNPTDHLKLDRVLEYILVNRHRISNVDIKMSENLTSCKQCGADIYEGDRFLRLEISSGGMRSNRTANFCRRCVK